MNGAVVEDSPASAVVGNPFRGSIVNDPWGGAEGADVVRIHQDVFDTCLQAVAHARLGTSSAGVIVYGEAGSGKTHLIGRLRRRLIDTTIAPDFKSLSQAFVYVRLNANPAALWRHVRQRIAEDLLRGPRHGVSQLERMVVTRLMEATGGEGHIREWWEYMLEECRDTLPDLMEDFGANEQLSQDFVRVLTHVVLKQHRGDAASWLKGTPLRDEAYGQLQVAAPWEMDAEQESKERVTDFLRLAGPQLPLVLCFDQVEALQSRADDGEALFKYGQFLSDLHDTDRNLVLISCVQSSLLSQMAKSVPQYSLDRMKSFAAKTLQPLTFELARDLLLHRIRAVARRSGPSAPAVVESADLSPLTEDDVRRIVGTIGCTPRVLLDRAASRWEGGTGHSIETDPPLSLDQRLSEEWQTRLEKIRAVNRPEETERILGNGIRRLVSLMEPEWRVEDGSKQGGLDFILSAPKGEARVGVKIIESSHKRLTKQLKDLLTAHPGTTRVQKIVLLRDERRPIPKTSVKALSYVAELEKGDGLLAPVGPEAIAALEAIHQLLGEAAAGDLDLDGEQVGQSTVEGWLRENLPMPLKELADQLLTPVQDASSTLTGEQLQELLNEVFVTTVNDAAARLAVPAATLTTLAEGRRDLFGLIRGEPTVVFSVRQGSRCLSSGDPQQTEWI